MQVKKYLFCNCALELTLPDDVVQERYYNRFLADFDTPDFCYEVIEAVALPAKEGVCIYDAETSSLYRQGEKEQNFSSYHKGRGRDLTDFACKQNDGKLYICEEYKLNEHSVFEGLRLPELLLQKGIGLLHCSFIEYEGQAILFAGDKQVGKSTQADLWQKHKGAATINGDRAGLYFKDNKLFAGGIPYCGTSDICVNKNMPVRAIICLSKGAENEIKQLSAFEAFISLLGKFSFNTWDKNAIKNVTDLVSAIGEKTPVYAYSCRKDETAVSFLDDFLKKEA